MQPIRASGGDAELLLGDSQPFQSSAFQIQTFPRLDKTKVPSMGPSDWLHPPSVDLPSVHAAVKSAQCNANGAAVAFQS